MQSVIQEGTGQRAKALGRPAAGKTGTTNDTRDAWFIGYTPEHITGIWVGFDDERSIGDNETGSRAASPIWVAYMAQMMKNQPVRDFPTPEGIEIMKIDPKTGEFAFIPIPENVDKVRSEYARLYDETIPTLNRFHVQLQRCDY
jgi:penicillin-binding protein 1A